MRNKELNMETVLSPAFCRIWENSLMGVMIIDCDGVYHYMNRLLIRTDDLQDEKIIGKKNGLLLSLGAGLPFFHPGS